ncbi:Alpha,alpha-trehalose-phosphate synthase [UDP-forming] [Astathelohania contejeani]|uniref:Alpha,alpha-trehalose-phosphate synthase [UDP-forming] n=1 Tax=Astathelohania contejeani TaxID=164912 RepID=A0ABQ7HYG6_9MICR|nr:Alpha,alpha-trehalose-phosphate synthase [UDP-forming] [Thelohania contejeani]
MRLIIVSNRLPISIKKTDNGFEYKESSGGLVTGLVCVKEKMEFVWVGNIGGDLKLTPDEQKIITNDCWEKYKSIPVFIDSELNEKAYNGFCNGILWPLLHSFPDDVNFSSVLWEAYVQYNTKMCDQLIEMAKDDDVFWVHDYHLMILPQMIRDRCNKKIKIGFFLHVPWPSSEIFDVLPVRKEIVLGIMNSDLVSFHLYDYLSHFANTCEKLFPRVEDYQPIQAKSLWGNDLKDSLELIFYGVGEVDIGTRKVMFAATPIGIEPKLFRTSLAKESLKLRVQELKSQFKNKKIILGVDRVDYIKGIPNRIKAFECFLDKYPQFVDKVVFFQIGVPSRLNVTEYESLVSVINRMVGTLNSKYGGVDETFFYFLNKSVDFDELCGLYSIADACIITSIRDGMNLVALEYIACQEEKKGCLILSEFAGAQTTLPGAISINPWNIGGTADAIYEALTMDEVSRKERFEVNNQNIEVFTAVKWAEDNIELLSKNI